MTGPGGQPGSWGATVRNLDVRRQNSLGETSFTLKVPGSISLVAGHDGVDRIPVMGPSGAGKSTFLNLLSCTSFPQTPDATVSWTFPDGVSCSWGMDGQVSWKTTGGGAGFSGRGALVRLRQRYFGYAFQTASLQPQLTIGENLTFGLENTGVPHREAVERAMQRLTRVFSGDEARAANIFKRYDTEVSGGERQRISLMQALIRDPYVLFADEPTGSLDSDTRALVMSLLTDWLNEDHDHRLLVWVTHHARDPQDNGADHRMLVADGGVRYQALEGTDTWVDDEAPHPDWAEAC